MRLRADNSKWQNPDWHSFSGLKYHTLSVKAVSWTGEKTAN